LKEESEQRKPFEITIVTNGCIDGSEEMTKNSFAIPEVRSVVPFTTTSSPEVQFCVLLG
jgi:hypothetical protein